MNIPSTVKKIGEGFRKCFKLTSITIPEGLTEIGDFCFSHCTGITEITIPATVTTIGDGAFSYSGIKKIVLPEGVKSVGTSTFSDCENLSTVLLPSTIASIGSNAFLRDTTLTSIYCFALKAPTVGKDAFLLTSKKDSSKPVLYVPMYSKVFYNQKTELSNYVDIIEMADETTYSQIKDLISTTTGISSIRKASTLTKDAPRYNLSGQRVSDSYKGIVIQNGHKYVAR